MIKLNDRFTWLTLNNSLTAAVVIPALTWCFLNLVLTLIAGHPSKSTVEIPYVELPVQILFASFVFLLLARADKKIWLLVLTPLLIWVIIRGSISGVSIVWGIALSLLLLSPLISLLLAANRKLKSVRALKVSFVIIVIGQLVTFPLNFTSFLMDDDASIYDRFSGTLMGKGGYFSSYILLAAAFLFLLTKAHKGLKVGAFALALAYAWFAEVKLIWFVAGVVAAAMLAMTAHRKDFVWKLPLSFAVAALGAFLSVSIPSSLGLHSENMVFTVTPGTTIVTLTGDGSKVTVIESVMTPWSELWVESGNSALIGVGPTGGLSHLSRIADQQALLPGQVRPTQDFRDTTRALAGSAQQDQSLATQPETTVLGLVSELGYIGLVLFLVALSIVIALLFKKFDRPTVGLVIGFIIAFVPLFSIWEISGFWMVLGLGLAAFGRQVPSQPYRVSALTES